VDVGLLCLNVTLLLLLFLLFLGAILCSRVPTACSRVFAAVSCCFWLLVVVCEKPNPLFVHRSLYLPQLFFAEVTPSVFVCVQEDSPSNMHSAAVAQLKKLKKNNSLPATPAPDKFDFAPLTSAAPDLMSLIPSPASLLPTLTPIRDFNLMFQTNVGAVTDASSIAFLRPETAQGIFVNFKNAVTSSRMKIPFGIAQVRAGAARAV